MALTQAQLNEYLKGLAKEKGFDEARTGRLVALVEGDEDVTISRAELRELVTPIVEHPLARQAAFSREMDTLKEKHQGLDKWHREQALPAVQRSQAEVTRLQSTIEKYEGRFGKLDDVQDIGGGKGVTKQGDVVDMTKVNELLANRDRQFLAMQLDQDRIIRAHFERFKEIPNISELVKVIGEKSNDSRQLTLDDAYNEVYGTRVQEFVKQQDDLRIKTEVDKAIAADRARRPAPGSGATVGEVKGDFWDHHNAHANAAPKKDAAAPAPISEVDLENAFAADLVSELATRDGGAT
jgi:tyrosine-protein phosphatase YwqE